MATSTACVRADEMTFQQKILHYCGNIDVDYVLCGKEKYGSSACSYHNSREQFVTGILAQGIARMYLYHAKTRESAEWGCRLLIFGYCEEYIAEQKDIYAKGGSFCIKFAQEK